MGGIAVFGVSFVDIKGFPFGTYLAKGRNLGRVICRHGGVSRNVAENLANAGDQVTFFSLSDCTAVGRDVVDHLAACGVDVSHVRYVEAGGLGMWMVILDESGDVAGEISCMPDTELLGTYAAQCGDAVVRAADAVILEIDAGEAMTATVLASARKYGKPVYAIVGNMSVILAHPEWVRQLSCFICNETEIARLLGMEYTLQSPAEMLACLREQVAAGTLPPTVVTMGSAGAVFAGDGEGHSPAISVEVVDTTGAGDAFLAGAVSALTHGMQLNEAVCAGTKMAALVICSTESACPRQKNIDDV